MQEMQGNEAGSSGPSKAAPVAAPGELCWCMLPLLPDIYLTGAEAEETSADTIERLTIQLKRYHENGAKAVKKIKSLNAEKLQTDKELQVPSLNDCQRSYRLWCRDSNCKWKSKVKQKAY